MKRTLNILESILQFASGHFTGWIVFLMMVMIFTNVVMRYFFAQPLIFVDELASYAVVATVFLGLGYTWKEKGHVRITFVIERIPLQARNWLRLVTVLLATTVTVILIKGSYWMIAYSLRTNVKGEAWPNIPQAWPQMILIIGSILLLLALIGELVKAIKACITPGGEVS